MAGAIAYATASDVSAYLPTATQSMEQPYWTTALNIASRGIDRFCERYFYPAGSSTKYFDGNGVTDIDDGSTQLYIREHDFYSLTALKVALVENNNPADSTQWYTISGDGVTPPSNFYLEPSNPQEIGSSNDNTSKRPFYRIVIPGTPDPTQSGNVYLNPFTKGKRTVSVTASWGWPTVPDEIKDVTVKVTIRMWRAKEAGQYNSPGGSPFGEVAIARYLDPGDWEVLQDYRRSVSR